MSILKTVTVIKNKSEKLSEPRSLRRQDDYNVYPGLTFSFYLMSLEGGRGETKET